MSRREPPLLLIAEGRRVRMQARRAAAPSPKEITLHMEAAALLRKYCRPDWRWAHIPSGEKRDGRTAAKLKRMGAPRGWPDFVLFDPRAHLHALELKRIGGTLSEDQVAFQLFCIRAGARYCIADTPRELRTILLDWRCLDEVADAACRAGGDA